MEAAVDPIPECHILTNSPALHSLKRRQLVQLCKRNGIKASGKNSQIVEKLKAHGSLVSGQPFFSDDDDGDKENKTVGGPRPSQAWSVIGEESREAKRIQLELSLPSPQPLNVDDSRDQSMLDLGASTVRLVTTAPIAPSPPVLRPFTPTFEPSYSPGSPSVPTLYPPLASGQDSDPLPPGGFSGAFSTPSGPPGVSSQVSPPFVFGSPVHHISNTEFNSTAKSVLAEMNARLGLTGTSGEVGLDLLHNRGSADAVPLPELQDRPRTGVTSMFDRAHERQFQKMEGLGEWYARRNASLGKSGPQDMGAHRNRKRKSDVLGDPHRKPIGPSSAHARRQSRVVTPGTRRSLAAAAQAEDMDGRKMKRLRISVVDGGEKKISAAANSKSNESESEETAKTNEERERERAAIKKRLEISRARRRSSMGRVSVGGGKQPLIPNQAKKGTGTKFGFLSSAKNIVKSVWKGVGNKATKHNSALPVTGPSQRTVPPAAKKSTPNVLTKPAPVAKSSVPKPPHAKASTVTLYPNTTLRIPATGIGLGRKASPGASANSTIGTRSSATSSGMRSITAFSAFGIPTARRGPIPSFQQPLSRISRTNSLASVGGTLGSRTSSNGTGSSQGSSTASSIGLKKPGIPPGVRGSDVGNSSTNGFVRKRTSTLLAPTASSLAKMQSIVRPPSLSRAALRPNGIDVEPKALPKVPEQTSVMHVEKPSLTFAPPPQVGVPLTTNKGSGSIFSTGAPIFASSEVPGSETHAPKPREVPARRPRISRSRVIARVGAQRAASGASLTRTPSGRRSFNGPKTRGSLGMRVSGIGSKTSARDSAVMSARKRLRQSEILRKRSKLSGVSPPRFQRDITPNDGDRSGTEGDQSLEDPGESLDISMDG